MKRLLIISVCLAVICVAFVCRQAIAQDDVLLNQDIVLLNQDGEKVGVAKDVAEEKIVAEPAAREALTEGKESATLENGVIKVVGPDGEVQEFNMSDARSVTITRSSNTVIGEDGQPRIETRGKAILIGPDGVRREIDLDNSGNGGQLVKEDKVPKSWMIGVACETVSPTLRSQLQLDEDVGLVVRRALGGGAAEEAGVKSNDIILYADQKPIATQRQLTEVVNEAGAAEREISMTVLRAGEEVSLSVMPSEREGLAMPGLGAGFGRGLGMGLRGADGLEFRQFGPGVILGENGFGGFGAGQLHRDMMEKMNLRMQQLQEEMEAVRGRVEGP